MPTVNQIKAWWRKMNERMPKAVWSKKQWKSIAKGLQEDNGILLDEVAELEAAAKAITTPYLDRVSELKEQIRELQALSNRNCFQVPKGRGFCDYCANEQPELCRYVNTAGALKRYETLKAQVEELEAQLECNKALIKDIAGCCSIRSVAVLLDRYYKALEEVSDEEQKET